jgi:hypothetical protein
MMTNYPTYAPRAASRGYVPGVNDDDEERRRLLARLLATAPAARSIGVAPTEVPPPGAGASAPGPYAVPPPAFPAAPIAPALGTATMPRVQTGTAPLARVGGRTVTRPTRPDSGDPYEDAVNYRRELDDYTDPAARDSRPVAGLKLAPAGFARGAQATGGSLAGGLGGALASGVVGLIRPDIAEKQWREGEKAKADQQIGRESALRKAALEAAGVAADVGYKRAQADYARERPDLERERNETQRQRDEANAERYRGMLQDAMNRTAETVRNNQRVDVRENKKIEQTGRIADNNIKFKTHKAATDRADKKYENDRNYALKQEALVQRVKDRLSAEARAAGAQAISAKGVRISEAKARAWARLELGEGQNFDDFVDALTAEGVEIVKD